MSRRNSHDMQVNVAGIRRNLKNVVHNYSDAQKKVREATSNDPWGPSSTIMAEVADLTYNVVAFSEIMHMVWKRLNDHGKNWRHVYKALVLLEYLIKTGSEKVGQQCKENIFAIQTLKDFQHLEEGKDQGQNVREKAKQLVNLLKDDERLKNERARAIKAKERFTQSTYGFETPSNAQQYSEWGGQRDAVDLSREIEIARPQTAGEEELQLQLALAMSREDAEQEEQKRKSDDVRLQLALSQSQQDFKTHDKVKPSHVVDLLDVDLGENKSDIDPWGMPQQSRPKVSAWQGPALASPPGAAAAAAAADPWAASTGARPRIEPWGTPPSTNYGETSPIGRPTLGSETGRDDPWSPTSPGSSTDLDEFDLIMNRNKTSSSPKTNGNHHGDNNNRGGGDPFEMNLLGESLSDFGPSPATAKKTPQSFLGENSSLVNLDNLVTPKPANPLTANPFSEQQQLQRPVFNTPAPKPTINEIKQASLAPFAAPPSYAQAAASYGTANGQQQQFGSSSASAAVGFGSANGANSFATGHQMTSQDPWTPVPASASNSAAVSPWMKNSEPANPFLS